MIRKVHPRIVAIAAVAALMVLMIASSIPGIAKRPSSKVGVTVEADRWHYLKPEPVTLEVYLVNYLPLTIEVQADELDFSLFDPSDRDIAGRHVFLDYLDPTQRIHPSARMRVWGWTWDLREVLPEKDWEGGIYAVSAEAEGGIHAVSAETQLLNDFYALGWAAFCVGPQTICAAPDPAPDSAPPYQTAGIVVLLLAVGIVMITLYYRTGPSRPKR